MTIDRGRPSKWRSRFEPIEVCSARSWTMRDLVQRDDFAHGAFELFRPGESAKADRSPAAARIEQVRGSSMSSCQCDHGALSSLYQLPLTCSTDLARDGGESA